jgi:hypothetical protein
MITGKTAQSAADRKGAYGKIMLPEHEIDYS